MMRYYNDNDPKACAWLRELIAAGLIPDGRVDNRSILEIKADELAGYDQCHFFAGVGFWSLALRWAGLEGQPGIWTGSCPCQPFSCAGAGKGVDDERHLWPVFRDLIRACRPAVVFGEQVASAAVVGKVGRGVEAPAVPVWLDGVRADMEAAGYAFGASVLGAHSVGAPHIRQRCYWVAERTCESDGTGRHAWRTSGAAMGYGSSFVSAAGACRPSDSIQRGLGGRNLGGLRAGGQQVQEPQDGARIADESCDGHADAVRPPDAEHAIGRAEHAQHGYAHRRGGLGGSGEPGGTRNAAAQRPEEHDGNKVGGIPEQSIPWSGYRIHRYLDGKDRRIPTEPWLFPLADDRHPLHRGRVGLLRGAGNAIVPALAAEFIAAWVDCRDI